MDQAQSAAGTGEAEQPTQTQQEPKAEETVSPLQAAVRKELGIESQERPKEEPGEKPEGEEPEEQPEAEPKEEQPAEPAAAEAEAEGEDDEHEEREDWPSSAKTTIAEERRKKRERTKERDQWKATAETLHAQLQEATAVRLPPNKALSHVVDKQSLDTAEAHWTALHEFALRYPNGGYDIVIGTNPDGSEQRRDFTPEEIADIAVDSDRALRLLPQKRAFIAESEAQTKEAKKVYPDLFRDTQAGREAAGIVQRNPWILQEPDWAFAVGDYLAGRKMRLAKQGKNGPAKAGLSPGAQAILEAPKVTPAPGVIKSRSASSGPGSTRGGGGERVDDKRLNEEFYAKGGTSEALEDKIRRKLEASRAGRQGGKQAALV
jgi:hypothetical protein